MHFSNENNERGAQRLRMKMLNAELHFKGATDLRLGAACSKIAPTSIIDGKTRLLSLATVMREYQSKFSTDHSSGEL